ncbi:MAG: RNA polymerase factor sigma-54 [Anaerolineales bacterium]
MLQLQDHSLRHVATAHLAQTMSLLSLSNEELKDKVMEELAKNPALELLDEIVCPNCHTKLTSRRPCPRCSAGTGDQDSVVFLSAREAIGRNGKPPLEDDAEGLEPVAPESLAIYVLQQLAPELGPAERPLAAYVLSSLNEEGFLAEAPAFIARATRSSLAQVGRVLGLISHCDPPGLATAGPREALLAQLDLFSPDSTDAQLASRVLQAGFESLASRDYEAIARALGVRVGQVRKAAQFIQSNLNPFPARAYWGSGRSPRAVDSNVYHAPDILISQSLEGPMLVEIFSSFSGWLRVNPDFRKALPEADVDQSEAWKSHLERASLFVKCLQQRNNTMRKLMEQIVGRQREFILEGDRKLSPMTRAELATRIGVHESTVSRAVANKGIALPDGRIIPLARFFDRSLSVRDRIKELVGQELKPLTDDEIASVLSQDGIQIARRTVAKYRSIEGILPARLRKKRELPA